MAVPLSEFKQLKKRWKKICRACGYQLVLEPTDMERQRYLRTPSLGALLFTQGWMLGARMYLLFALSLIPVVGLIPLIFGTLFGRQMAWKFGGWRDWQTFRQRMRLLDIVGIVWIALLIIAYFLFRQ